MEFIIMSPSLAVDHRASSELLVDVTLSCN